MKKILNSFFLLFIALAIFNACSDVPAPYEIGGGNNDNNDIYINESFSSSLGNFRSQSALGNLKWKIDFSSAVITGFDKTATPQNQAGYLPCIS